MTTRTTIGRFVAIFALVAPAVGAISQDLRMSVRPLYEGLRSGRSPFPLRVTLENLGPPAQGAIRVQGDAGEMVVPVELPQGARKAVTVVARLPLGQTTVLFDSNRGRLKKFYENPAGSLDSENAIALVTDTPGLMGFLRDARPAQNAPNNRSPQRAFVGDAYVPAEDLPDREIGLDPLAALVLGEGSERLTDAQVAAIEGWVVGGGSLVFMGGSSTPVLADARWDRLLPVKPRGAATVPGTAVAPLSTSRPPDDPVTVTANAPKPGTKVRFATPSGPLVVEWRVGLGKVTFLAFNLFESPLTGWDGRRDALLDIADPYQRASVRMVYGLGEVDPTRSATFSSPVIGGPPSSVTARTFTDPDPFQTRLPDAGQIILILSVYFVLVVPVSFLALRRLGRGELAWITAPVLSLLFAGVLFYSARELYKAGLSRLVTGSLVAAQGIPGGRVYGTAQVFFPTGGSYDLSFPRTDWIAPSLEASYGITTADCAVVDQDGMRIPSLGVPNLSFRQFDFRQAVDSGELLELRFVPARLRNARERYRGTVRNTSSYTLVRPVLFQGRVSIPLGASLEPGQEFAIDLDPTTVQELPQPERLTGADPRVVLVTADIETESLGPQLGSRRPSSIRLLFVGRASEVGS
ncbi:MAG: hypothetical protein KIS66_07295 [Fimbriimonadaceae bacterium]|nr:hypothetical protein [Fimbriimonadaceae bacterium]